MSDVLARYLARVAFEGIEFPTLEVSTDWGHDSAKHQGLLTAGADIQTTGLQAATIQLRAVFLDNLKGWPKDLPTNRMPRLLAALRATPLGTLAHPTRGNTTVHVDHVGEKVQASLRNGFFLDLTFTEHSEPATLLQRGNRAEADPVAVITGAAAGADAEAATLPAGPPPVLSTVTDALDYLESAPRGYTETVATLGAVQGAIRDRLASPAVAGIDGHAYRVQLEALLGATYAYRDDYLGANAPTTYTTQATMSLARLAALLYGDPAQASLLLAANAIADPSFVPAGTPLLVLPSQ